jgi:hypothetical protein
LYSKNYKEKLVKISIHLKNATMLCWPFLGTLSLNTKETTYTLAFGKYFVVSFRSRLSIRAFSEFLDDSLRIISRI